MSNVIVITGASSGIGQALAAYYTKQGQTVIGLSRTYPKSPYDWDHRLLDLGEPDQIEQVVNGIHAQYKHIDVLINNAGYGIADALEYTKQEDIAKMFQVNVLGTFALSRLCMPLLRGSNHPKIIIIGSVAGEIPIPFQAVYSMCKAALHVMSDAWRMELKPFKIDVCTILPGDTKTAFTAHRHSTAKSDGLYGDRVTRSIAKMARDEARGMPVEAVVKTVARQIKRRKMKPRVTVGLTYKVMVRLNHILPKRFSLWLIYRLYGK